MGDTLDLVLSDESITLVEALRLLRDHLISLNSHEICEVKEDLKHAFSEHSPDPIE